jgi:uncharacterized peroxidase-related enzyme
MLRVSKEHAMTWIRTVSFEQGDANLQDAMREQQAHYPPEYASQVAGWPHSVDGGIVAAHSLIPEGLRHAFGTFAACMASDLPLTRRQHEIIATVVSATNRTRYCSLSHAEFLRHVTLDNTLARQLSADYRTAPLTEAERVMAEYSIQVTRDATRISRDDHARLREAGFDDVGILQITMIAAWFNYINRMADALGVGRD